MKWTGWVAAQYSAILRSKIFRIATIMSLMYETLSTHMFLTMNNFADVQ